MKISCLTFISIINGSYVYAMSYVFTRMQSPLEDNFINNIKSEYENPTSRVSLWYCIEDRCDKHDNCRNWIQTDTSDNVYIVAI